MTFKSSWDQQCIIKSKSSCYITFKFFWDPFQLLCWIKIMQNILCALCIKKIIYHLLFYFESVKINYNEIYFKQTSPKTFRISPVIIKRFELILLPFWDTHHNHFTLSISPQQKIHNIKPKFSGTCTCTSDKNYEQFSW